MQHNLASATEQPYKKLEYLLIGAFFCWLLYSIFWGERIPEANGLGYDGVSYAGLAIAFPAKLFHHKLSIYALQRILPSGIIYYMAGLFHFSLTNENMAWVFSIYNTIILMLAVFIWQMLAKKLNWTPEVRLISFAGLFLNYAILKMNTYYSVLTDTSAFVCGLFMVYCFLLDKKILLLLTMVVGAFIFPTLMYVGFILFVFAERKHNVFSQPNNRVVATLLALISAIIITLFIYKIYHKIGERNDFALGRYMVFPVLCISVSALFVYFFFALLPMCQHYFSILLRSIKQIIHPRVLLALFLIIVIKSVIHLLANGLAGPLTPKLFLEVISVRSLAYPFIFLVSHVIYYGPIVCLFVYFWQDMVNYLQKNYLGLLLVTACYVILAIDPESRQIINFLPIAVIALCQVLNSKKIPSVWVYLMVFLSLLLSRVWLPLNHGWVSLLDHPPQVTLEFPLQWYFMSQGPWMSHTMYVIYLIVTLLMFGITYFFKKKL